MIISEIKLNKKSQPIKTQRIVIKCDDCDKEWESFFYSQIKGIENYNRDLCRGCKQKEQIKLGIRTNEQYIKAGEGYKNKYEGKKIEEIIGYVRGKEKRKKQSKRMTGKNNSMYNKNYQTHGLKKWVEEKQKGKTYEEIYGKEKSDKIKEKIRLKSIGENNNMFGKPSPQGSGNGWSGWYKEWFFRSLKELSFMINVIERFNFKWESAETNKYKISYINDLGRKRNYFPDFILDDKYLVEIKPKPLHNTIINKSKKEAALLFCKKNNLKYKMLDVNIILNYEDINKLLKENKIKFTDRYQKKFNKLKK